MGNRVKLTIPRVSNKYMLYIYRSYNADDINTVEKIKNLNPVMAINEKKAIGDSYEIYDTHSQRLNAGCAYYGPEPVVVPPSEYETQVDMCMVAKNSFLNVLNLKPLPLKYNGQMLYYSVIGVDEENNTITHLSKVSGIMAKSSFMEEGNRKIYVSDNIDGKEEEWKYLGTARWDEEIKIGDRKDLSAYDRWGIPVIEKVPVIDNEQIKANTRMTLTRNFMVLEIQNPWQNNKRRFNFRKLKSYKIQNCENNIYSKFSVPTFQSVMPVPIEKMTVFVQTDCRYDGDIPYTADESMADKYEVIRKDGIFYDYKIHRSLGFNKFSIPLGEKTAVFNEASVQDEIKIQVPATTAHTYKITVYLTDIYGKVSEPSTIFMET